MSVKEHTLQDLYLNSLRKEKTPVVIFLTNGVRLKGIIEGFDNFVVLIRQDRKQLVYKHAISTIVPDREAHVKPETQGGK